MGLSISHYIRITNSTINKDGVLMPDRATTAEKLYRYHGLNYPKFFKMDHLCKWAWLGAELLLSPESASVLASYDRDKIAMVIGTRRGSLDVDRKYQASLENIASPALFVYTLSNIMLGEIAIRHGFKGEQLCLVQDNFDPQLLHFYITDMLQNRNMQACVCGWADAVGDDYDIFLCTVENQPGTPFSAEKFAQLYEAG